MPGNALAVIRAVWGTAHIPVAASFWPGGLQLLHFDHGGVTPLERAYAIDCPRCSCWFPNRNRIAPAARRPVPQRPSGFREDAVFHDDQVEYVAH